MSTTVKYGLIAAGVVLGLGLLIWGVLRFRKSSETKTETKTVTKVEETKAA